MTLRYTYKPSTFWKVKPLTDEELTTDTASGLAPTKSAVIPFYVSAVSAAVDTNLEMIFVFKMFYTIAFRNPLVLGIS